MTVENTEAVEGTEAAPEEPTTEVEVEYNDNLGDDNVEESFDFAAQMAARKEANPEWYEDEENEDVSDAEAEDLPDPGVEAEASTDEAAADTEGDPPASESFSRARRVLERKEKQLRDERTQLQTERAELDKLRAEVGATDVNKRKALLDPQEHLRTLGFSDQQLMELAQDIHLDSLVAAGAQLTPEQQILRQARQSQRTVELAKLDKEAEQATAPKQPSPQQMQQLQEYQQQLFSFEVPADLTALKAAQADPARRSHFKPAMWEVADQLAAEYNAMGIPGLPSPQDVADRLNAVLIQQGFNPQPTPAETKGSEEETSETDELPSGQPRKRVRKSIRQTKPAQPRASQRAKNPDDMSDKEYEEYCRGRAAKLLPAVLGTLK